MKLKEIDRTANQAWSPAAQHPIYLATGTSAQQLDATFSTNAALEVFELDLADSSTDLKLRGTLTTENRYHKLVWGAPLPGEEGAGVVVGGSDNGVLILYAADKVLSGDADAIIGENDRHTGPVRALDFNPFQANLLASGANDSEIYIWDLNNFGTPMTPGSKSQPAEDVVCVAWNRQVQHILASASPSGKAVVWDLRKNEPIIKVSDHSNRMRCSGMAWHPDVATQLVVSSEDDRMPVIQMWDLRFATSPLKVLESHSRGILAIAWCQADPELLLSCAKDNRILCWNPNTGEVVYELPTSTQWCFDIQWCPRNPALLSAASFDGRIGIYSVMGGSMAAQTQSQADKISSSFGNLDPFGTGQPLPPLQLPPQSPTTQSTFIPPLKRPPRWIRRPVGACFAFGGKLVTFGSEKAAPAGSVAGPRQVFVSQVVTETALLRRSDELQGALRSGRCLDYCVARAAAAHNDFERSVWNFLKVNFEQEPRTHCLKLLGYSADELDAKISAILREETSPDPDQNATEGSVKSVDDLEDEALDKEDEVESFPPGIPAAPQEATATTTTSDGSFKVSTTADVDGLISQALLLGNFERAVELCLHDGRMADAVILSISGGSELLASTQKKYFARSQNKISRLVSAVVSRDWEDIARSCDLDNWKEALAALLTYAKPHEFPALCDTLGSRMEQEGDETLCAQACLCYICAGNVEKLVACWDRTHDTSSGLALQDLIEKVMVMRQSMEACGTREAATGQALADKLAHYAGLLAAQGSLAAAMSYLPESATESQVVALRDRLYHAQQEVAGAQAAPPFPYTRAELTKPQQKQQQQYVQPGVQQPQQQQLQQQQLQQQQLQQQPQHHHHQQQHQPQPAMKHHYHPQVQPSGQGYAGHLAPHAGPGMPGMQAGPGVASVAPNPPGPGLFTPISAPLPAVGPMQPPPLSSAVGPGAGPNAYSRAAGPNQAYPPHPTITGFQQPMQQQPLPAPMPGPSPHGVPHFPGPSYHPAPAPAPPLGPQSSYPSAVPSDPHGGGAMHAHHLPVGAAPGAVAGPQQHGFPGHPGQIFTPGAPYSSMAPVPPPAAAAAAATLQHAAGVQDGWNDPPPCVRQGGRRNKLPENYVPPAPITAPVFGVAPLEPQGGAAQASHAHEPSQGPPGAPTEASVQPLQSLPAEKIVKKPIPEEHGVLKVVFDGLVQRCLSASTDPQTKRKLDDATKRLEYLYDKLREQTLSPHILAGLHEIARRVEARDYPQGLAVHTQVVSSSNFSEISAFMPVLKVVVTIAGKLNI
uniref:Protein transport protein Sec31A n=1 Tax=Petromyzon marinus TaxID=7757 RepID=A0AAJ7TW25_PETMA|nr:protein transport protein Sec31A-like isoform X2 [Petromyzon marinus]